MMQANFRGSIGQAFNDMPGNFIVMILGASTPSSKVWFDDGVDFVSGTRVTDPEMVLRMISEGIVFKQIHGRGVKLFTIQKENYQQC